MAVLDAPFDFETLVREELIYQGFPELLWTPLYHYVLIFEGVDLLANNPEDSLKSSNKQPILIFNGMDNDHLCIDACFRQLRFCFYGFPDHMTISYDSYV